MSQYSGTVKWFNLKRGYGFIVPDEGGRDVFVHISALQKAGLQMLWEQQRIQYNLAHSNGKIVADNLEVLTAAPHEQSTQEAPLVATHPESKPAAIEQKQPAFA